ncbi:MAG: PIN domain-containing protein [Candidatus Thermoplasmatota archaeon]|nr:PIN domain-containing protein [Candidatus Thermoplasmatota archaeon]
MKKYLLDTNILLRFLVGDVPSQYKISKKLLEDASQGKVSLFIAQIVIFEVDFGLVKFYKFNKKKVIGMLESLVGISYIKIDNRDIFKKAIKLYKDLNLDLVDCFLLAYKKEKSLKLFTFDKKLQKAE